jgi:hypothetical protein
MNVQPAKPNQVDDPNTRLQKIKQLLDAGLISREDFDKKKAAILAGL